MKHSKIGYKEWQKKANDVFELKSFKSSTVLMISAKSKLPKRMKLLNFPVGLLGLFLRPYQVWKVTFLLSSLSMFIWSTTGKFLIFFSSKETKSIELAFLNKAAPKIIPLVLYDTNTLSIGPAWSNNKPNISHLIPPMYL